MSICYFCSAEIVLRRLFVSPLYFIRTRAIAVVLDNISLSFAFSFFNSVITTSDSPLIFKISSYRLFLSLSSSSILAEGGVICSYVKVSKSRIEVSGRVGWVSC